MRAHGRARKHLISPSIPPESQSDGGVCARLAMALPGALLFLAVAAVTVEGKSRDGEEGNSLVSMHSLSVHLSSTIVQVDFVHLQLGGQPTCCVKH